jgi:soluble lytic murein transglycosylase-like protein
MVATKLTAIAAAALALLATEARADIVVFKNGRTMSVKSCLVEAETATLRLRDGGEVTFPASILARVDPDEVPYPEDAPVEAVAPDAPVASFAPVALALVPEAVLAARPYAELISTVAATHKLDARLVHAVIEQESNYQARARSKKGAKGLMQLMPDTARQYGVRNSYDPKANLEAGVRHLKDLMSRLELPLALAAYNAGEATIKRYGGVPPYAETQNYVRSILRRVGVTPGSSGTN